MRLAFSLQGYVMSRLFSASIVLASLLLAATPARAEKFGFCEDEVKSATQCFLVMTQETYRKCRIVQTMMIIEYGFPESYLPDNNGEKLNFCIDKHRRGIQLPYQAALKEFSELGSGLRLAALDLELRGAGNLLGTEQQPCGSGCLPLDLTIAGLLAHGPPTYHSTCPNKPYGRDAQPPSA